MRPILRKFSGGSPPVDQEEKNEIVSPPNGMYKPTGNDMMATTLGADIEFKGALTFKNRLTINGKFEGTLFSKKGNLMIGKDALIKCDIHVGDVQIEGTVDGNIFANGSVSLRKTAQIHGDIKAIRLSVEDGVVFQGYVDIGPHVQEEADAEPHESEEQSSSRTPVLER